MRFSIITPSYNQAPWLEQTLNSVLTQSGVEVEYWVMDGGSTDASPEIIRRYADRLAGWVSEKDRGQTDAINKGLGRCTGDIVGYINSDDWYLPGALAAVAAVFADNPEVDLVAGAVENMRGDTVVQTIAPVVPTLAQALGRHQYRLHQPGMFWRRRLVEQHGLFDPSLHCCFDHEYWVRLLAAGARFATMAPVLARFRLHSESKTCSIRHRFMDEDRIVFNRYCHLLCRDEQRLARTWLHQYEAGYFTECVYGQLQSRGRTAALRTLMQLRTTIPHLPSPTLYPGALIRILTTGKPPGWFGKLSAP